jgi:hypothetical protein
MIPHIEYQALCDFTGLETIRRTCASRNNGIRINNIPVQRFGNLILSGNQSLVCFAFHVRAHCKENVL